VAENANTVLTTAAAIVVAGVVTVATAGTGTPAAVSAIAAGAAGGFTGGFVGTSLNGGSFGDAMKAGFEGAVMGAIMGGITAGIGSQFGAVTKGTFDVWRELGRASAHALAQGGFSAMRGGDFWQGAAAGFASSLAGSAAQSVGIKGWGMVGISAASGGVGAAIAGGRAEDILFGMVSGAMVGMFNHMGEKRIAKHFANRNAAYEYMYKNSIDENGNPIREVAGWVIKDGGVVVLPFDRNGKDYCDPNSLPIYKTKTGRLYLQFNGKRHFIETFIHTHPINWKNPNNPIGLSPGDIKLATDVLKRPILILYAPDKMIYSIDGSYNYDNKQYNYKPIGTW
jgi:hypothetical protein